MNNNFDNVPWWQKGLGLTAFGVIGYYVKQEIGYSFRGKKPHPGIEDELDDLDERLYVLESKNVALQNEQAAAQERICSIPEPESLDSILKKPVISYSQLFGPWIWEGGITTFFSPTKIGKTTCAIQVAYDIANGSDSKMLPPEFEQMHHAPQPVIYYDLESDETDFQERYGMALEEYGENLKFQFDHVFETSDELLDHVEHVVAPYYCNVTVFIDNISMIGDAKYPSKTERLIKRIKDLQVRFKNKGHLLTFVLIAHTHKTNNDMITLDDISGSANFGNLSRSILALEKSGFGNDYRILKLLDSRKKDFLDDNQVILMKRVPDPFLHFEFVDVMDEKMAVAGNCNAKEETPKQKPGPKDNEYDPLTRDQYETLVEMVNGIEDEDYYEEDDVVFKTKKQIAEHFGIPPSYINRYLNGTMKPVE